MPAVLLGMVVVPAMTAAMRKAEAEVCKHVSF